ncbi:MAG: LacI family transcriptional regulator [Paenibacillus lautus]|uniref:LacI family DNA-binding transcriptional regulator n=2 Tax=Paenibacillus lautus TaxID=1401 RepID=UPI0026E93D87|nr:LacI family DNA-binding transcriptional regulator [Paenibacillus lautus]MCI1773892.1 LacI family transcriptional regulator [Paenibacillus lautus]
MMAATIKDVAREAGVAVCTVSFAVNGSAHVAEATKKRIFDAIEKLNYRPNQSARGLVTKKTNNIGLVVEDTVDGLENTILLDVVKGLGEATGDNNYDLLLSFQKPSTNKLADHLLDVYRKQSADGLILMGAAINQPYGELIKNRFPFVLLGRPAMPGVCHSVNADNEQGAYEAVKYLIGKGHRRIALITPCSLEVDASLDRYNGYRQAMEELGDGFDEGLVEIGSFEEDSGYTETEKLLSRVERPTAIIAGRDVIASRVVEKAQELGYKVPEDLAVIGFDNTAVSQLARPSITSIELPMRQMGLEAAKLLMQLIDGEIRFDDIQTIVLPCTVIEREST